LYKRRDWAKLRQRAWGNGKHHYRRRTRIMRRADWRAGAADLAMTSRTPQKRVKMSVFAALHQPGIWVSSPRGLWLGHRSLFLGLLWWVRGALQLCSCWDHRVGARLWLSRIMITMGDHFHGLRGLCAGAHSVFVLRFNAGAWREAGFLSRRPALFTLLVSRPRRRARAHGRCSGGRHPAVQTFVGAPVCRGGKSLDSCRSRRQPPRERYRPQTLK